MRAHVGSSDESNEESLHGSGVIIMEVFMASQAWARLSGLDEFIKEFVVDVFNHFIIAVI